MFVVAGIRDRKKERTKQAIICAAVELFEERGYEATTVADIAARADIATRTFFGYFASKEDLLFPESDDRVAAAIAAIAARGPEDRPADVLLKALENVNDASGEMLSPLAALRLRLFRTVPAVRGKGLQLQLDAAREIARHLHAAYPDELDEVSAAAVTGAFIGAVASALDVVLEKGLERKNLREAMEIALRPWRNVR